MTSPKAFQKLKMGFSLVEMLVVVAIFSVLAVISTQALSESLRGTNKSENLANVRDNVDYTISVIERYLRNAQDVACSNTPGGQATGSVLNFTDEDGEVTNFSCQDVAGETYIAIGTGNMRLTNPSVTIVNCGTVFSCVEETQGLADKVTIQITARDESGSDALGAETTSGTTIILRNR